MQCWRKHRQNAPLAHVCDKNLVLSFIFSSISCWPRKWLGSAAPLTYITSDSHSRHLFVLWLVNKAAVAWINSYNALEVMLLDVSDMNTHQCCILTLLPFRPPLCSYLCTARGHETRLMTLPPPLCSCGDVISINISDECCTELAGPGAKTGQKGRGWMGVQLPAGFRLAPAPSLRVCARLHPCAEAMPTVEPVLKCSPATPP